MEKIEINDIDTLKNRRKALAEIIQENEKALALKGTYIKENLLPILISTLIKREPKENNKEWLDDAIAESISFAFALTEDTSNIKDKILSFAKKILATVVKGMFKTK
jgi:hypothetical protein